MAKVGYVDITEGLDELYLKALMPSDRFVYSRIVKKQTLFSRKRKKGMTRKSLLPQVAESWHTLSTEQQAAWKTAAAESNLKTYNLFVQDQCLRLVNDMAGIATPSLLHQSLVGLINVEAPATEVKIAQYHPRNYYVSKKVRGTKSQYEPVLVTEDFALPLSISINYKSVLTPAGPDPFAKFYASVWHSYQGVDRETLLEIPFSFASDWTSMNEVLTSVLGYVVRYDLFIHIHDLRGQLYFDNVKSEHSGQNWARDPFCKDINQGFTRAFYQIPKHWSGVILPEGSYFESIYLDF